MVPLILGIIGSKDTGKSTVTLKLSSILVDKEINVSIIKFSRSHYTFEPKTTDSALFHTSQAKDVIFSGPFESVIYKKTVKRSKLNDLMNYISKNVNIVLCESYPNVYPIVPCIFVVRNISDYYETKNRYINFKPLFVTGPYAEEHNKELDGLPVLSLNSPEGSNEAVERILVKKT
jgi:molybdopterin-guanine dinucleotide biosynthesis protein MobB